MSLSKSEQARINGAKSRGPKTAEGKRVSSRNACKHGLTAQSFFLLSTENPEELDDLVRSLTETFKPCTDLEKSFIAQAAAAQWRLRRLWIRNRGLRT
jgi:hypothetical protein